MSETSTPHASYAESPISHAPGAHLANLWRTEGRDDVHFHPLGGEIGIRRVADADAFQPLGAQADLLDGVARGNAAPRQLAIDEVRSDRLAREPQARQRDERQHGQHKQRDAQTPGPACDDSDIFSHYAAFAEARAGP